MSGLPNGDLIVVVPGILGSSLSRRGADGDERRVWGYGAIVAGLGWPRPRVSTLADRLTEDLALDARAFDDPERGFDDGVVANDVLRTQALVPGFWEVQGYDQLLWHLRTKLDAGPDEVFAFPYDWRQSNRVSAHRLQALIDPIITERRRAYPDASAMFIGHSMGGLVARYYAEKLDSQGFTRRVVTIGTPYQGAVKALAVLANGYAALGGRKLEVGELVRSWPSAAELLPAYPCFGSSDDDLRALQVGDAIGDLPAGNLQHGLGFHQELGQAVNRRPRPMLYRALFGYHQPTDVWASVTVASGQATVEVHRNADPLQQGDGTVPRCSSWPPEWESEDLGTSPSMERHSGLQQAPEALRQLVMLASTGKTRTRMAGDSELVVEADAMIEPGAPCPIMARALDGSDRLALEALLFPVIEGSEDGTPPSEPVPMQTAPLRADRDQPGLYRGDLAVAEPGLYRWQIRSVARATTQVEPVSDLLLCCDD